MKKMLKQNKAITLIALVITIVILIILAGVLINITFGEKGLIIRAKVSKQKYEYEQAKEILQIKLLNIYTECIKNGTIEDYTLAKISQVFSEDDEVEIMKYYEQVASVNSSAGSISSNTEGMAVVVKGHSKYTFLIKKKDVENSVPKITAVSMANEVPTSINDSSFSNIETFEQTVLGQITNDGSQGGGTTPTTGGGTTTDLKIGNTVLNPSPTPEALKNYYGQTTNFKSVEQPTDPTASDYDKKLALYNIDWQLFYDDAQYVYLIASDYVPKSLLYVSGNVINNIELGDTGNLMNPKYANENYEAAFSSPLSPYTNRQSNLTDHVFADSKYSGSDFIAFFTDSSKTSYNYFTTNYLSWVPANPNSSYDNIQAVSFMFDSEKWDHFKGNLEDAFVIGGPTVELFVKSYNSYEGHEEYEAELFSDIGYRVIKPRW